MSALRELYQQVIIDHGRHPRNHGVLENATHRQLGYNPLCGDKLELTVRVDNEVIQEAQFVGSGCAISMASASLMTEILRGKSIEQAQQLFQQFHHLLTGQSDDVDLLGKLSVLAGVAEFPARVKCATLAWHTLNAALAKEAAPVSTE
jgi:nitrogen fixation NifU-like protein